jgi:ABC-type sugar transport systems, permease components
MRRWWLAPYVAYIVGFGLIPFALTFYFVGLNASSIKALFLDFPPGTFQLTVENTLLFSATSALFATLLALVLATRVDSLPKRWQMPLSLLILSPYTIPFTASTMVWYTMFDPLYGPFYYLIELLHLPRLNLTAVPGLSIWAVSIVGVWSNVSFAYLVIVSGFRAIGKEMREVAQIDGASKSQYYSGVALPYVFKIVATTFLIIFVIQLGNFDIPFILTQGRPGLLLDDSPVDGVRLALLHRRFPGRGGRGGLVGGHGHDTRRRVVGRDEEQRGPKREASAHQDTRQGVRRVVVDSNGVDTPVPPLPDLLDVRDSV